MMNDQTTVCSVYLVCLLMSIIMDVDGLVHER